MTLRAIINLDDDSSCESVTLIREDGRAQKIEPTNDHDILSSVLKVLGYQKLIKKGNNTEERILNCSGEVIIQAISHHIEVNSSGDKDWDIVVDILIGDETVGSYSVCTAEPMHFDLEMLWGTLNTLGYETELSFPPENGLHS